MSPCWLVVNDRRRRWTLSDGFRVVAYGILIICDAPRCGAAGRVKLNRFNVFHINGNAALPAGTAHQNRELLVFEIDDLAMKHAAVFKTDRVSQRGQTQTEHERGGQKLTKERLFHSDLQVPPNAFKLKVRNPNHCSANIYEHAHPGEQSTVAIDAAPRGKVAKRETAVALGPR